MRKPDRLSCALMLLRQTCITAALDSSNVDQYFQNLIVP